MVGFFQNDFNYVQKDVSRSTTGKGRTLRFNGFSDKVFGFLHKFDYVSAFGWIYLVFSAVLTQKHASQAERELQWEKVEKSDLMEFGQNFRISFLYKFDNNSACDLNYQDFSTICWGLNLAQKRDSDAEDELRWDNVE